MTMPNTADPTLAIDLTIEELVRLVATCRQQTTQAQATLASARSAWEYAHGALFTAVSDAQTAQAAAEAALRDATLTAYATNGSKHPHPATGVRVTLRLIYDREAITTWARINLPSVLMLDVRTFERVAVELHVPGVRAEPEPQATIAGHLRPWLPDGS